jgi:hypothetical protein
MPAFRIRSFAIIMTTALAACGMMPWQHPTTARAQDVPPPEPAQGATSPAQCWAIAAPVPGAEPPAMVMMNKCTGETWLLAKTVTREPKPNVVGAYVYRWHPISKPGDAGEAEFSMPSASQR